MPSAVHGDGKINIQPEVTMAPLETRNTRYFFFKREGIVQIVFLIRAVCVLDPAPWSIARTWF